MSELIDRLLTAFHRFPDSDKREFLERAYIGSMRA